MLPPRDRRTRLQHEERGEAETENELDMHIEDVLGSVLRDAADLPLLMDATANEIDSKEP